MEKIIVAGVLFLLSGMDWLFWFAGTAEAATIVYAVVSCIVIEKRRM